MIKKKKNFEKKLEKNSRTQTKTQNDTDTDTASVSTSAYGSACGSAYVLVVISQTTALKDKSILLNYIMTSSVLDSRWVPRPMYDPCCVYVCCSPYKKLTGGFSQGKKKLLWISSKRAKKAQDRKS